MENIEVQLLTQGRNEIKNRPGSLIEKSGPIKWTNKRECPPQHSYNKGGWVQTNRPYPKVSVCSYFYLSERNVFSKVAILLQNLLALRILNNKPHELLLQLLIAKDRKLYVFYEEKDIDWVRTTSLSIDSYDDFPSMDRAILRWDTLWSSELGRAAVNKKRISHHIHDIRDEMDINRKYKTREVREEAKTTLYAVKEYWKEMGWSVKDRTYKAFMEALEEKENATVEELVNLSGLSTSTVYKLLPK